MLVFCVTALVFRQLEVTNAPRRYVLDPLTEYRNLRANSPLFVVQTVDKMPAHVLFGCVSSRFLKPEVTLRAGANIQASGVLMLLTVHDKTISGKINMYDQNGGRINTYKREMERSIQSIRHFSPRLPIAVVIDFEEQEHPEAFGWLMRTADYVVKQTIPSAKGATWGAYLLLGCRVCCCVSAAEALTRT